MIDAPGIHVQLSVGMEVNMRSEPLGGIQVLGNSLHLRRGKRPASAERLRAGIRASFPLDAPVSIGVSSITPRATVRLAILPPHPVLIPGIDIPVHIHHWHQLELQRVQDLRHDFVFSVLLQQRLALADHSGGRNPLASVLPAVIEHHRLRRFALVARDANPLDITTLCVSLALSTPIAGLLRKSGRL